MNSSYSGRLVSYACNDMRSYGRMHEETHPTYRNEYQRDRDRIIHSAAFRRLEYKTQVFVNHEGDLFRTRLTHSLEVAQIARSIARELQLHEDLSEAIALAHDLGHTPFGHAGQTALNDCMKDFGGFEHNIQSLRVVDKLEQKYADFNGLNLTFETREGILKHCAMSNAKDLGDVGKRFLEKTQPSLEAQLTDLSDETAYNNHDIDDGIRYGLINIDELLNIELFRTQYDIVNKQYSSLDDKKLIHEIIRRMINVMVVDLIDTSRQNIADAGLNTVEDVRNQGQKIMAFSKEMSEKKLELKQFLRRELYQHYRVHRMTKKAADVIEALFNAFMDDLKILPSEALEHCNILKDRHGERGIARGISDYIAGMTDRYAIVEFERIFNPRQLSFVNLHP
ncbi:MAG: deoxyguanosinetriphosphate triphosphohydrolase [Gammaproteobacteria bacterium]|nr:deoxyguanosinetriphosphate triphosphohydrolase [Gammaproteobacteria bacterium]MBT8135045.1 deoxyguanosinetriphosphate triphosphohydrolase [Gammaproteobacteria bacterium]NNJ50911.1 deoxyguanosinetriphosphate triphosphohydrolase [Gammaproteobacteria bacterium]